MLPSPHAITPAQISGVVLAGGRGMRMGGVDKGLQLFHGVPLALHALRRLQMQVGSVMVNANRHLHSYQAFGAPVWPDALPGYQGPLAGFLTALRHCETPYLVTVPCDAPMFPTDLVARLAQGMVTAGQGCEMVVASTPADRRTGAPGWTTQPVFCLLRASLLPSLEQFTAQGGRKAGDWTAQHQSVNVQFDDKGAFLNVNTLEQLQAVQP